MIRPLLVALLLVRIHLKDRTDVALSLLLPVAVFAVLYGVASADTLFHTTLHVVNEDTGGAYSVLLVDRLKEVNELDVRLVTASQAERRLGKADRLIVLHVPEDFSRRLVSGEQVQLALTRRGISAGEAQVVAGSIRGLAEEMAHELQVRTRVAQELSGFGLSRESIDDTVDEFLEAEHKSPTVRVKEETVGGSYDPVTRFLPGILTMFVLFAVTLTARTLVEEREKGTLERLFSTQLGVWQLFLGKFMANLSRGFLQILILLLLAYAVFRVFSPVTFIESLVVAFVFVTAVASLGLIIGAVARTENQATWIAVSFTMVMVLLGGTFLDTEGSTMDIVSRMSINTYANDAFEAVMVSEASLPEVGLELAVMAGVAVAGFVIARGLFRIIPGAR